MSMWALGALRLLVAPTKNSIELPLLSLYCDFFFPSQSFANQHPYHSFHTRTPEHLNKASPKSLERILPITAKRCSVMGNTEPQGAWLPWALFPRQPSLLCAHFSRGKNLLLSIITVQSCKDHLWEGGGGLGSDLLFLGCFQVT